MVLVEQNLCIIFVISLHVDPTCNFRDNFVRTFKCLPVDDLSLFKKTYWGQIIQIKTYEMHLVLSLICFYYPFPNMYNQLSTQFDFLPVLHTPKDKSIHTRSVRYIIILLLLFVRAGLRANTHKSPLSHTQSCGAVGSRLLLKAAQGWWSSSLWDMTDIKTRLDSSACLFLALPQSVCRNSL